MPLRVNAFISIPFVLVLNFLFSPPLQDMPVQAAAKAVEEPSTTLTPYSASDFHSFTDLLPAVRSAMEQREGSLQIRYTGDDTSNLKSELDTTFQRIFNEDNYLHYVTKTYQADYAFTAKEADIRFSFTYWETREETDYVNTAAADIVSRITQPQMSTLDKEKAIHDWIAEHVRFDDSLQNHSAFAGLSAETGYATVCQGYALLFYKMLSLAGIESQIVSGSALNEEHIWNMVKLNGSWVHVDTTWDRSALGRGSVRYTYFNLTNEQIAADHQIASE